MCHEFLYLFVCSSSVCVSKVVKMFFPFSHVYICICSHILYHDKGVKINRKATHSRLSTILLYMTLQKQKGFREQQQNREERRSQREAKLAEKQARDRDSVCAIDCLDVL